MKAAHSMDTAAWRSGKRNRDKLRAELSDKV
jgi:hypothetical protein